MAPDVCPCHGVPWYVTRTQRYCQVRRRINWAVAARRYAQTAQGHAVNARNSQRKLYCGRHYIGRATTPEQAAILRPHIRRRLREFTSCRSVETHARNAS